MKNPSSIGARIISGLMVLASAGLISAALILPSPPVEPVSPLEYIDQEVSAQAVTLSCPAAFTVSGYDDISGDDFSAESESQLTLTASSLPQPGIRAGVGTARTPVGETDGAAPKELGTVSGAGPNRLTLRDDAAAGGVQFSFAPGIPDPAAGSGDAAATARAGAVATQITPAGDGRSLIATMCPQPQVSQWLVGPDTQVGSSAELVLANPGLTPVTVSFRIWGTAGQLDSTATYALAPGQMRTVLLEASTLEARLAVEVTSTGGPVAAVLYHHVLDGLTANGVDSLTASTAPAQEVWISPFKPPTGDDQDAELVLVNPHDELANATVSVVGPQGTTTLAGAERIALDAHTVVSVPLGGIDENWAGLLVESDQPVTASTQVIWQGKPNPLDPATTLRDRTWIPAATPAPEQLVVIPEITDVAITASLVNTTDTDQMVTVAAVTASGAEQSLDVTIPARSSHQFSHEILSGGSTVTIQGTGIIGALWLERADELGPMISVMNLLPDQQQTHMIPVAVDTP